MTYVAEQEMSQQPHDLAAEQVVLGGMLLSSAAIADVAAVITAADHYRPAHQIVHEVILALWGRGDPTDAVAVAAELTRRGLISRMGGHDYLHDLIAAVPVAVNAGWYARVVKEQARLRALVDAGTRITQIGYSSGDPDAAAEAARLALDEATATAVTGAPPDMTSLMNAVLDNLEAETERGIPTGIARDLDEALIGGLVDGQLVLVGARPGVGKSICVTQSAVNTALRGNLPVLMASLEMTAEEITTRIVSAEAKVPLSCLLRRRLEPRDWERINRTYESIASSPLVIDYAPGCTMARIRSRLRSMQRTGPARLLVVDYLQLVADTGRASNRQEAVASVARDLKNVAGEFSIPVLVATQLNRNPERRTEKRPELADLRESGEQEAAADVVILLDRPDAYEHESPRAGEMDLIIAKQRQGAKCTITVAFQGDYARVVDMAPDRSEQASAAARERGAA